MPNNSVMYPDEVDHDNRSITRLLIGILICFLVLLGVIIAAVAKKGFGTYVNATIDIDWTNVIGK
ncbi:hypothetical protein PRIPAC_92421 [Pristionchus pacificus]|uniref:Uncharacterized protein n=1 Tax=Pristionchus pacificus TaxID=54126 RepID=A0A2A6CCY9_PRIPA|nr:hypothetical protein PRIPAC_92421 [Pristionchus pacificus]|eukprot:PDM75986.1 hypothetical protein PRIPAC_39590 [Pristionchus pacificus]